MRFLVLLRMGQVDASNAKNHDEEVTLPPPAIAHSMVYLLAVLQ